MKFEYKILTVSREHMKRESFQTEMLEKFLGRSQSTDAFMKSLSPGC